MIHDAQWIVRGKVIDMSVGRSQVDNQVCTYPKLAIQRQFKGTPLGREITMETPGGNSGKVIYRSPGTPEFKVGAEVVVFLWNKNGPHYVPADAFTVEHGIMYAEHLPDYYQRFLEYVRSRYDANKNPDYKFTEHEALVLGKIREVNSFWNKERTAILTNIALEIMDQFRGTPVSDVIRLRISGGTVMGFTYNVKNQPDVRVGDMVLTPVFPQPTYYYNPDEAGIFVFQPYSSVSFGIEHRRLTLLSLDAFERFVEQTLMQDRIKDEMIKEADLILLGRVYSKAFETRPDSSQTLVAVSVEIYNLFKGEHERPGVYVRYPNDQTGKARPALSQIQENGIFLFYFSAGPNSTFELCRGELGAVEYYNRAIQAYYDPENKNEGVTIIQFERHVRDVLAGK
ncbi:MAG TPA: hypothetical protein VF398_03980 [bacterium]